MASGISIENVDPALLSRIAQLSPGSQRWLKTAIITMRTMPARHERESPRSRLSVDVPPQLRRQRKETPNRPPDMEDIITGKVDAKELDKHPELAEQLEGMGEIIDMLRGLGESRRKRGEQILREEILGLGDERQPNEDDEDFSF
jgi:hypothetical protein